MKALVYTNVETLDYRDVPEPVPREGEVLIRIMAAGICGSDMHAFLGHDERRLAPLILGHEAAGVIVSGEHSGKRVTINPLVTCGTCRDCRGGRTNLCADRQIISMKPREGAFAQLLSMPFQNLVFVPDNIAIESAALAEPLACGWHAVRIAQTAIGTPLAGIRCLVIGGGGIGVSAALSLNALGADNVVVLEPNDARRTRIDEICSFTTVEPGGVDVPAEGSIDLVIDSVGTELTRGMACQLIRPGGVIVHIGLGEATGGLDVRKMTLQEIQFIGTYTYTAEDFRETARAIFDGRLGALDWTELRSLSDGMQAFADIRSGKVATPKIVLIPEHHE